MFVWECIKTEGKHLGTCVDGFLFGSCCAHNDTHNSIDASPTTKPSAISIIHSSFVESFSSNSSSLISYNPIIKPDPQPTTSQSSTWPTSSIFNPSSYTTKAPVTTQRPIVHWTSQNPWFTQASPIPSKMTSNH
jgi:serine proteinase stubble